MDEHQGSHDHTHAPGCGGKANEPAAAAPAAATTVTDPVCGMTVNPQTSKHRLDLAGTT